MKVQLTQQPRGTMAREEEDTYVMQTIMAPNYLGFVSNQNTQIRLTTFKNMCKVGITELIAPYFKDNKHVNTIQMADWLIETIDFTSMDFSSSPQQQGNYLYYIQEQLVLAVYRAYLEAYRFKNPGAFNADLVRKDIEDLLIYVSKILY